MLLQDDDDEDGGKEGGGEDDIDLESFGKKKKKKKKDALNMDDLEDALPDDKEVSGGELILFNGILVNNKLFSSVG